MAVWCYISLSQFRINVFVFLLFIYCDVSKVLWIKKEEDLVAFNDVSLQNCMLSAITSFAFLPLENGIQRIKIQAKERNFCYLFKNNNILTIFFNNF